MAESRSLGEIFTDVANRKQRAAQAHLGHGPESAEAPKDVYAYACATIADAFKAHGYRFAKSGPRLSRKSGDFDFRISFQSSHNNVAGESVAIWIHAKIVSPTLKKWRIANQSVRGPYDFVAGGQIGNLAEQPSWLEWNVADPAMRDQEIELAINTIRKIALPYFAEFENPAHICEKLTRGEIVGMDLMNMFDYAACFASLASARAIAAGLLSRRPHLLEEYHARLKHLQQSGLPDEIPSGWPNQLAAVSVRFNLGDLTKPAAVE